MDREPVLVCLATYNERETLPVLIAEIFAMLPASRILVIDDASPDGTGDWCDKFAASDPRVTLVRRPAKMGLGSAHLQAMDWATRHEYRWLITMDADGSHDPRHLPAILARARAEPGCDIVIGSRYCPGGSIRQWPWRRRWISQWVNRFARWSLRVPARDCTSGFRCYRVERLRDGPATRIRAQGFAFFEESLWRLSRQGLRIAEVPIEFVDRQQGRSKADWWATLRAGGELLQLAWLARRDHRDGSPPG